MAGTGVGTSINTLTGISVAQWNYRSISPHVRSVEALDDTHLGSTNFMEMCPHELESLEPLEIEVLWNYKQDIDAVVGTEGSIVIKMPLQGASTQGDVTGSGFIQSISMPVLGQERTVGTITYALDGTTMAYNPNT